MAKVVRLLKSKNIIIYLLLFSTLLVGIGLNFFLARVLGSDNFGRIQFLVALATTCSHILIFGLNFFLIRGARNKKHSGEVINKCFSLFLTIVLFFVPIVYCVLNNHINETQNNLLMIVSVIAVSILMGLSALLVSQAIVNIAKYSETWYSFKKNPLNKKKLLSIAIVFAFDFAAIWSLKYIPLDLLYWLLIGGAVGVGIVLMNTFIISLYGRNDFKTLIKLKL